MRDPIQATFIGGPLDLTRKVLPNFLPKYVVPVLDDLRHGLSIEVEDDMPEEVRFKTALYHGHRVPGPRGSVFVYIWEGTR